MAARASVAFRREVAQIDLERRWVTFADGTFLPYGTLLSTLPLNRVLEMAGLTTVASKACPDHHWLYLPGSRSGFHRVGFYSNVDRSFLPAAARRAADRVSIYVERSFPGGQRPSEEAVAAYGAGVVDEQRDWGFIDRAEVVHPTWIEVAYSWAWPGSRWRSEALQVLQDHGIFQIGRYGRWRFQGIAESIGEGFVAGSSFRRL